MEFPLFETLAIEQGKIRNIERHQQRYERSLQAFYGKQSAVVFSSNLSEEHTCELQSKALISYAVICL